MKKLMKKVKRYVKAKTAIKNWTTNSLVGYTLGSGSKQDKNIIRTITANDGASLTYSTKIKTKNRKTLQMVWHNYSIGESLIMVKRCVKIIVMYFQFLCTLPV